MGHYFNMQRNLRRLCAYLTCGSDTPHASALRRSSARFWAKSVAVMRAPSRASTAPTNDASKMHVLRDAVAILDA